MADVVTEVTESKVWALVSRLLLDEVEFFLEVIHGVQLYQGMQ